MNPLRIAMGLLVLFMLVFPVWYLYNAWVDGVIFVSIPLFAMFVAGIVGLSLVTRGDVWKKC